MTDWPIWADGAVFLVVSVLLLVLVRPALRRRLTPPGTAAEQIKALEGKRGRWCSSGSPATRAR